jgi:phosphoenolpyruvate phosphomutase
MRSCITAMQRTTGQIFKEQSLIHVEDRVAPLSEVFRLQGAAELEEAEKRYLPKNADQTRAVILGAAHGPELGALTEERPKCMLNVAGSPVLSHIVNTYRAAGVKDIVVVRGYRKEAVNLDNLDYFDNDDEQEPSDAYSLFRASEAIDGHCIISYGDVLFRKYIPQELMEVDADFAVIVDTNWRESRNRYRYADYVTCSEPNSRRSFCSNVKLLNVAGDIDPARIHGEWMGFLKVSKYGAAFLRRLLAQLFVNGPLQPSLDMGALMREIIKAGKEIRVLYTTGNWLDVDSVDDVLDGSAF